MASHEELQEYLEHTAFRIRSVIVSELASNPKLIKLICDLQSLGIGIVVDHEASVQCFVRPDFKIPNDLSVMTNEELDKLIPDADFNSYFSSVEPLSSS